MTGVQSKFVSHSSVRQVYEVGLDLFWIGIELLYNSASGFHVFCLNGIHHGSFIGVPLDF